MKVYNIFVTMMRFYTALFRTLKDANIALFIDFQLGGGKVLLYTAALG